MVFNRRNIDWWCERGILALVLAALMFAPLAFGAVYAWTFLVLQALAMGVGLLWLARIWGGHKPKLLWPPLAWVVVAFVLYATARYFTSDNEYIARLELIRIFLYAFMFLAVTSNLYSQEAAEAVVYTLTITAALASTYAVAQFFHHSNQVWNLTGSYPGRGSGTYINPDHFAGFLELVLPLPLALLLAGRVGVITRVLLLYAILTILGGLTVTFSRGGWVAAAAGVVLLLGFLLCHRNHRLRALLVLAVFLVAGGVFVECYLSHSITFMRRVESPDRPGTQVVDAAARLETWGGALRLWQAHPWWGVGVGQFDYRFREYRPEIFQMRPEHAHDDYLELLDDFGLAGGAIVAGGLVLFGIGLRRTWPHVRRQENDFGSGMSNRYAFFLGAVCGLFALAVHSFVDFNLHVPANALAAVVILALVASNLRFATKRYWVRMRLPLQCAVTVFLGALLLFFSVQGWRRGGEMVWARQAENMFAREADELKRHADEKVWVDPANVLSNLSNEQIGALQKALAYEPQDYLTAYNLGECYRLQSWDGGDNYADLAQKAMKYYALGMQLNPYDELCPLRYGMCLDLLGRHDEAWKYYAQAEKLDPNGNFVVANIGWHFLQIGDYSAAHQWFLRAARLSNWQNDMAKVNAFDVCEPKLEDRASGRLPIQLYYH